MPIKSDNDSSVSNPEVLQRIGALKFAKIATTFANQPTRDNNEIVREVLERARKEFGDELGSGAFRYAFAISRDTIMKVPKNLAGMTGNVREAAEYMERTYTRGWPLPETVLADYHGLPVVLQERTYIEPDEFDYDAPNRWNVDDDMIDWQRLKREGKIDLVPDDGRNQTGYTVDGRAVIYDFAEVPFGIDWWATGTEDQGRFGNPDSANADPSEDDEEDETWHPSEQYDPTPYYHRDSEAA